MARSVVLRTVPIIYSHSLAELHLCASCYHSTPHCNSALSSNCIKMPPSPPRSWKLSSAITWPPHSSNHVSISSCAALVTAQSRLPSCVLSRLSVFPNTSSTTKSTCRQASLVAPCFTTEYTGKRQNLFDACSIFTIMLIMTKRQLVQKYVSVTGWCFYSVLRQVKNSSTAFFTDIDCSKSHQWTYGASPFTASKLQLAVTRHAPS